MPIAGRLIRTVHHYAADATIVAIAWHLLRMLVQGRTWGPRALAWVSGCGLLGVVWFCGWTGLVMVWDGQGLVVARAGAELLDRLPIFVDPIRRAFAAPTALPQSFFFTNLFFHVALPVGLALGLWLHVSRLARPRLLPPRGLRIGTIVALVVAAIIFPLSIGPAADLFAITPAATLDHWLVWWIPVQSKIGVNGMFAIGACVLAIGISVPWWWRPARAVWRPRSVVNERLCTGCSHCYQDCPYEAISMMARVDGRAGLVARVDPARCVSCGICAGACAPMGVGPVGDTGREQRQWVDDELRARPVLRGEIALCGCIHATSTENFSVNAATPVRVLSLYCAGSLHASTIDLLLQRGMRGVLILACPPRNCRHREGPKWLHARLYAGREAELRASIDRRRIRIVHATSATSAALNRICRAFVGALDVAGIPLAPATPSVTEAECPSNRVAHAEGPL